MTELKGNFNNNDLDLDNGLDIPDGIIFPNELNQFLKEKVQYLMHENGMLKKNLCENEDELSESKCKIEVLSQKIKKQDVVNEFTPVANVARTKIVELSKKLREKSSELATCKSKCSKLEMDIVQMQQKNLECSEIVILEKPKQIDELKTLQDKITLLTTKLFTEKNSSTKLSNELRIANKILQEETGFENMQQISTNWKGRAQIISKLQHKYNDLKEKLKDNKCDTSRKSTLEKRMEKASKENETLKVESEEAKRKLDALRSRYKNLDIECNLWKNKFASLAEQMEKDRELITSLTNQSATNQNAQNEMFRKKDASIEKLQKDVKDVKGELKKERCKVEHAEKLLGEKDAELEKLRNKINSIAKEPPDLDEQIKQLSTDRTVQRLEAERMRLVELSEITNQRLIAARAALTHTETLHRQERQRAAKFEAKIARLQLGESAESSYSAKLGREGFEYKLELAEETIKALQMKLDIERRERETDMQEFIKIIKKHDN